MKIRITDNSAKVADAIARAPEQVLPEIDKAMFRGAIEIADQQKLDAPKFRSEMANSIQVTAKPLEYLIAANAKHAVYVEEGTKEGGRPTFKEMLAWITLKRITPRTPGMTTTQLAHLLRHNIVNFGIPAQPFFYKAYEKKASRLTELLETAAATGLAKVGA
jgi:hypothetical protein